MEEGGRRVKRDHAEKEEGANPTITEEAEIPCDSRASAEVDCGRAGRASTPNENEKGTKPTYWGLFAFHPSYRWFLASYVVTQLGE